MTKWAWCPGCRRIRRLRGVFVSPGGRIGSCTVCRGSTSAERAELFGVIGLILFSLLSLLLTFIA